jgi:cyclophilin family peptidyl-prolyl cis-trans isomerase
MRLFFGSFLCWAALLLGCGSEPASTLSVDVVMVTDVGEIGIHLYDVTPIHKANFLKLSRNGFYDDLAFHRVIYDFMTQIGDPRTREAYPLTAKSESIPDGPGYTLEPEIRDTLIHTRGKLGAARWEDEKNPERRSSGSQFYIVTGEETSLARLDSNEVMYTGVKKGEMLLAYQQALDSAAFSGSFDQYLQAQNFQPFTYSRQQRREYLEEGGAPWLDFQYTIFGEVVFGMEVVDQIERSAVDEYKRPLAAIRIKEMKFPAQSTP